ncbi:hypothetical protein A3K34_02390 [candidate division WWE3 bacterium RIFOXYC1_FULL_40_10]|uniref:Uncharacterized protein n=1 Tax=candidate division WWE3 bacterium RIFOXYA2_FULL_46_9 TaxID=1802636 RepID=A0A1F4VZ08_UNCKA|nr:MAG: hypothetical protein A3K58_02390 [candidate division WWE3 bacterium RIFOXYB1_FULL_40_22]OGC61700.1 MAG: hypothetical protein A3K37_02390 [candidate division WWE3 bacterium RIFOXYA1_FULL_40_11]OGC62315.1 MAG: hypothetical protein A2264_01980 [candidate division WWE3 bacterium RIFOXYA2_FULL_46_9]OGC64875.1 MAG: hypothetical protein A2326_01215 [candidate division WWE3 bacterium RIFOXYB2_FULL_41_6]OGC66083.1 MAG: hypothetical protein A3K34_02390 [candidate division WWE3 bacterium RIFOXYC1_
MKQLRIFLSMIALITIGVACFYLGKHSVHTYEFVREEEVNNTRYIFIKEPVSGKAVVDRDGYLATGFISLDTVRLNEKGQLVMTDKSLLVVTCPNGEAVVSATGYDPQSSLIACGSIKDLITNSEGVLRIYKK